MKAAGVTLYKVTDGKNLTRGGMAWGENVTNDVGRAARKLPPKLCSRTVLHAYRSPNLAVFMRPQHWSYTEPKLWEAVGQVVVDDGTKVGCRKLTTVREIAMPRPTPSQCAEFAIRVAMLVTKDRDWLTWANGWLSGKDRSRAGAWASACAAARAAAWAAEAAARAAAEAARAAAWAAGAATEAASEIPDKTLLAKIADEVMAGV